MIRVTQNIANRNYSVLPVLNESARVAQSPINYIHEVDSANGWSFFNGGQSSPESKVLQS
jgi:hypothetical protein